MSLNSKQNHFAMWQQQKSTPKRQRKG